MNYIKRIGFSNYKSLIDIEGNKKLKSYPYIKRYHYIILKSYINYLIQRGDACAINSAGLPKNIENYLSDLYTSPPKALKIFDEIRESKELASCPMCGSPMCGTLDHVLPKTDYPEFAIFTPNLVPACKCNIRRSTATIGTAPRERVAHPYFDKFLSNRLISVSPNFPLDKTVTFSINNLLKITDNNHPVVYFQIESVLKNSGIINHCIRMWAKLLRSPELILPTLKNSRNKYELSQAIKQEIRRNDKLYESKNNWNSAFLYGINSKKIILWLEKNLACNTTNLL